jgi:hypothetical protein
MLFPPRPQLVSLAFILSLAPSPGEAAKCAAPPLSLAYRNSSIAPGVLTQGVPIQLGNPWQQVALTPSLQLDGTFIPRYTNSCVQVGDARVNGTNGRRGVPVGLGLGRRDGVPGLFEENAVGEAEGGKDVWLQCEETYGGGYVPSSSPTFHDTGANDREAEWWFEKVGYSDWHFITEAFRFADYLDVFVATNGGVGPADGKKNTTATFVLADEGKPFGDLGASLLGLTPGSTLLKELHDAGIIPSTSWTLTNESLCLGCMDETVSKGEFQIFKPADREKDAALPCLIQAKVEALNWHPDTMHEGATIITKSFMACIDPGVKFLVLPDEARTTFKNVVDRSVQAEYEDYMLFKGPPKEGIGLLTVKLEGGLEVNMTVPGAGAASAQESGSWKVAFGKGGWGAYGNQTFVLGKPFTDQVVIRWDSDKQEYGIAPVNTDTSRVPSLKPLGCEDFPDVGAGDGSKHSGTGVLIGSVLGAFVSGVFVALALLFFFRRGRKDAFSKYEPIADTVSMRNIPTDRRTVDSWISGALSPPPPSVGGATMASSYRDHSRAGSRAGERDGSGVGMSVGMGVTLVGDERTGRGLGLRGTAGREAYQEPVMVADNAVYESSNREVYEAPEGGTAYPTKRERLEIWSPDLRREEGSV